MRRTRPYFICLLLFFMGCGFPQQVTRRVPSGDDGQVIMYLQPMPQGADRLRFMIDGVSAVRDDGTEIPLSLTFHELKGEKLVGVQKHLASGYLPSGSYRGVSIRVREALLLGEEGESALLIPEEPIRADHPFKVNRRKTSALFLYFNASGAISDGVRFTPLFSLATPGRELVNLTGYVSNSGSNILSVFNKKTMQVVGVISTGRGPKGLVIDERRGRAYVAASRDDLVEVIDVIEGRIIGRVKLNFGDEPVDLAISPDGRTLVSVNHDSNTVSIIDAISQFEVRRIRVGEEPFSVVMGPSGLRAYIMNSLSKTLSVVDLTQMVLSVTIAVEGSPLRGAFSRDGNRLYVISRDSPNLSVIDPSRLIVTEKIFIGMGAVSIKVDTKTDLIYVGKEAGGEISVIDPFSLMFIDTIQVGGGAAYMTIDDEEDNLFVALPDVRAVRKVNLTSKRIMAEIEVGEGAYAVAVTGER